MKMQLRPYQTEAINSIYSHFDTSKDDVLLSLPTGTGKSIVIAEFMRGAISTYPKTRIVVATFAKELVKQNYLELKALWPQAPAGILSAGLNRKDFDHQIIFAGIQSAYKKAFNLQHVDLLIVDEVQAVPRTGDGMWQTFITNLRRINPHMRIIGLSATLYRMDSGKLFGPNAMFKSVCYEASVLDMIEQGYLSELVSVPTSTHLDVRGVGRLGGEFKANELEKAVDQQAITERIIQDAVKHGQGRRSWLVFASGISHAEHIVEEVRKYNLTCEAVTSKTSKGARDKALEDFKAYRLQVLVVIGIGTVGFNHPGLDYIIDLRPTESTGLHVQKLGRGLRKALGKVNCLVADYSNNIIRHGPIDKIRGTDGKLSDGTGEAPSKVCPTCLALHYAGTRKCECGYVFPSNPISLSTTASNAPILSTQAAPLAVQSVSYAEHQKPGKPPSFKVTYQCGISTYQEWILLEYTGWGRDKAVRWWAAHGSLPAPATVQEALARTSELRRPVEISIQRVGKYNEIIGRKFA